MDEARKLVVMAYCKLDPADMSPGDHVLLEDIYLAATDYMAGAGIAVPSEPRRKASYDMLVNALCLDAWERRDVTITGAVVYDNPSFRRKFNQLKLTEPDSVSDSDTSS